MATWQELLAGATPEQQDYINRANAIDPTGWAPVNLFSDTPDMWRGETSQSGRDTDANDWLNNTRGAWTNYLTGEGSTQFLPGVGTSHPYDDVMRNSLQKSLAGTDFLTSNQMNDMDIARFFDAQLQNRGLDSAIQTTRQIYGNDGAGYSNADNRAYFQDIQDQEDAAALAALQASQPPENWNENQDFLSWVPQQDWFSFMDQNASPDAVLNQLQSSYNTQGAGAQDIINEAYQVFQQGGGTPREAQSYQNMMQRPTLPQFTPLYNQNDTWGEAEFNPFDNPWDFDYYISQQGLLDAPTGPRPGSGAYMYAEDPNSIFSQEDQAAYQDYLGQMQAYQSQPPQQAAAQQAIAPTQQQAPAQQAPAQQAPAQQAPAQQAAAQQAAIPAQQQVSAQQQAAAQQFNPSTDFSLQTSGGFPTRNGIQTGYWDDNDQYNLPPVDYSMLGQFAGDAPPAIPEMDPGDMPSIIGGQAQINLGNQMADFATPNIQRDIAGTPWEDSFMNFMDNPMGGGDVGENGPSALDQLISGNYSWDQAGTDFNNYLTGIGGDITSFLGDTTGGIIGTDASAANQFFGTSGAERAGDLAGLAAYAGVPLPLTAAGELVAGLFDRAGLNNTLKQMNAEPLSYGQTLLAALTPYTQKGLAYDNILDAANSGAGYGGRNGELGGGADSTIKQFSGLYGFNSQNPMPPTYDARGTMAPTYPASGIPVPEQRYAKAMPFDYVQGFATPKPVQTVALAPVFSPFSSQSYAFGSGAHPGSM